MWIGRYEVVGRLGEGGQGTVYDAVHHGPGGFSRRVALKVVSDGAGLAREARLGGLLRHRHLVDCYEVGEHEGRWFLAMERCAGGSLDDLGPLPPRAVVEVGLAVCDALAYAHEELGLVHLDLKPGNLLLDGATVKVADLGIARSADGRGPRRVQGTPGYMAPEQARGAAVDARADVYALGVVLHRLATGRLPPTQATVDTEEPDPSSTVSLDALDEVELSAVGPDTDPAVRWLDPVLARCLAADPADRFASMAALGRALAALPVEGASLAGVLGRRPAAPAPVAPEAHDEILGRGTELAELSRHLDRPGLVTLIGAPGIGKSALARAAARAWRGPSRRCDLSESTDVHEVLTAVAGALDVPLGRGAVDALAAQLGHALADLGPALLVLDDVDPTPDVVGLVEAWLRRAPDARILVTSPRSLDLPVETVLPVPELTPEAGRALVRRRALERGVELTDEATLDALVARLDGVPLALELAAGRLGVLSLDEVAGNLSLAMLRSAGGDRSSTLSGALAWSVDRLDAAARDTLAQLAVFRGGFTLEAVDQIVSLPPGAARPSDLVEALLERSLVSGRGGRLRLLEPVREFASGSLGDDARRAAEVRHGEVFARRGDDEALATLFSASAEQRWRELATELDNVVAACERAAERGDGDVACRALKAAWAVLELRGPHGRALALAERVLAVPGLAEAAAAQAWLMAGSARRMAGAPAGEQLDRALAIAERIGDDRVIANTLASLGILAFDRGRMDEARARYEAAIAAHGRVGDARAAAVALGNLGNLHQAQGRPDEASAAYTAALATFREVGDLRSEGTILSNWGLQQMELGRWQRSEGMFEAALDVNRRTGNRVAEAGNLGNLGVLYLGMGRHDEARTAGEASLELHRAVGDRRQEAVVLGNLGVVAMEQGRLEDARDVLAQAIRLHREVGNRRSEAYSLVNLGDLDRGDGRLDAARDRYLTALGIARDLGNRRLEGGTLLGLGELERDRGDPDAAAEHLGVAEDILRVLRDGGLLVEVLCVRGGVDLLRGAPDEATARLAEARATLRDLGAGPESSAAQAVDRLARALAGS